LAIEADFHADHAIFGQFEIRSRDQAYHGGDRANEVVAKRIIELAKTGELNPDVLCEAVVKEFGEQRL
jgi:hypothetical protein